MSVYFDFPSSLVLLNKQIELKDSSHKFVQIKITQEKVKVFN